MSDTFITFRPTTGVYAKAIKPYKKWYHSSDMSKKIEIDGRYYRVVRTTGLINKLRLKKMVVCDENGQIVEDEEVTRQCFKWMMYLGYYQFNQNGIQAESTHGKKEQHEPLIELFQDIWNHVNPVLEEAEQELMAYHLNYLKEVYRLSAEIAEASKEVISCVEELRRLTGDSYPAELMDRYIKAASLNYKLKREFEIVLIESKERAGQRVRKLILQDKCFDYLTDIGSDKLRITDDIIDANTKTEIFIDQAKDQHKRDVKWSNDIQGPFTIEKYLYELRYIYTFKKFVEINVAETLHEHWVFT